MIELAQTNRYFVWSLVTTVSCPNMLNDDGQRLRWLGSASSAEPLTVAATKPQSSAKYVAASCNWKGPREKLARHMELDCVFVLCPHVGHCLKHSPATATTTAAVTIGSTSISSSNSAPSSAPASTAASSIDKSVAPNWRKRLRCTGCRTHCPFSEYPAVIPREKLTDHIAQCPHRLEFCTACGESSTAAFIWAHQRECSSCLVACEYCHAAMPVGLIAAHEQYKCKFAPEMECPRCLNMVPRHELLTTHAVGMCPDEFIRCPFPSSLSENRRCFQWLCRRDFEAHLKDKDFAALHEEQEELELQYKKTLCEQEEDVDLQSNSLTIFGDY